MGTHNIDVSTLAEKEALNFALFQQNPVPMVVVDQHGRVIKSNLARRELASPLPALNAALFDRSRGDIEELLASGLIEAIRKQILRTYNNVSLDGLWLNITMAPVPQGAVVILQDITARKQAEAESERQRQQLIQADKLVALGTLVSGVAHEVSNPNNAMILSGGALKRLCSDLLPVLDHHRELVGDFDVGARDYADVREELPELVDVLIKAGDRIKSIVNDLKTYARHGTEALDESVDVNAVAEAAANLLRPMIRKSTHRFTLTLQPSLPAICGNAQRIEQVLVNLLSNACQALTNPDLGVALATRSEDEGKTVLIEISDEGAGIPENVLERITDPFFTTRQDNGGTGLGLSISRTIVENHNGTLSFTSEPGRGTQARVRLPVHATGRKPKKSSPTSEART
jgi:signal transduction histidine kinase